MTDPKQLGEGEPSGRESTRVVVVYVCPNCPNYYGVTNMPMLEKEINYAPSYAKDAGQPRGTRAKCPDCGTERVRRYATVFSDEMMARVQARSSRPSDSR